MLVFVLLGILTACSNPQPVYVVVTATPGPMPITHTMSLETVNKGEFCLVKFGEVATYSFTYGVRGEGLIGGTNHSLWLVSADQQIGVLSVTYSDLIVVTKRLNASICRFV